MKNKIIIIFILMLMIFSTTLPISSDINLYAKQGDYKLGYPQDFDFLVVSGGFHSNTTLIKLHINSNGEATYSKLYPKDRATSLWTLITTFDFTENEMNQIWEEITLNDFFNLNGLYQDQGILDGTYAEITITGEGNTHTVKTENIPVVRFDRIIKKINDLTPGEYDLFYNAVFEYPPDQPSKPSGSSSGKPGVEYSYTSTSSDYNSDIIYYFFNWGDGTDSGWVGPYNSSDAGSAKHIWSKKDSYNITVKAKDDPNADGDLSDGQESIWSEPLAVNMPKSKVNLFGLLDRLVQRFPILEILQRFYNVFSNPVYKPVFVDDTFFTFTQTNLFLAGGTVVTYKNCIITVTINIQIRGPGATVNLTKDIEKNIEDVWNAGNWKVKCEPICDPREPGCNVKFDAVVVKMPAGEVLPGFHDITIVKDDSADGDGHISYVKGSRTDDPNDRVLDDPRPNDGAATTGAWDTNEPANTYAHEAGHLMGLDDTYPPHKNGFGSHIMNDNGAVSQADIDLIVGMSGVKCPCECCPEENDTEEPEVDIDTPHDGSSTTSPINVTGSATDVGGSGVAELDFRLEWSDGFYNGDSIFFNPPKQSTGFRLGPIYLDQFIEVGDWIKIIIYAIDDAGNIGSDDITVTLIEEDDNTPPVTIKTIGQPQAEDGYVIWPQTPIILTATDDMSGVNHIHYDIWWDSNGDQIIDIQVASQDIYSASTIFTVGSYGVFFGLIQLKYYAVDNAQNQEQTHIQNHMVMER